MATDQLDFVGEDVVVNGTTISSDQFDLTLTVTGTTGSGLVTAISGTVDGQAVTGLDSTFGFVSEAPNDEISTTFPYTDTEEVTGYEGDTYDVPTGISFDVGSQAYEFFDFVDGDGGSSPDGNYVAVGPAETQFYTAADTTLTVTAICYFPGTGIRTPAGDVAVEHLQIGDAVVTAEGRVMPIRWIGRNTVSTTFADPLRVLPIRIKAGALAENCPERDLLVSPEHAVLVDDLLIQAGALVNGISIIREKNVPETFTYYHVELAEHALLLAEGAPAESFVDNIHRSCFDNWDEYREMYAGEPVTEMAYPRALSRRQVPMDISARLLARGNAMTELSLPKAA